MKDGPVSALTALAEELAGGIDVPTGSLSLRVLDAIAAFAAGTATAEGLAVSRLVGRLSAGCDGVPWSSGVLDDVVERVSTVRLTEYDDIHALSGTTAGSVAVPVAVTVGAAVDATPEQFVRAIATGYEAMARLAMAAGGPGSAERGVWPTYLGAGFAAAAVTSVLLQLDAEETRHALSFALTRASWVAAGTAGTMPLGRWLTVGDAARSGCIAALAARNGFSSDLDLDRFAAATGVVLDASALTTPVAAVLEVSVKPFPIAKQTLAAVEGARRLAGRVAPGDIRAVRVFVPPPSLSVIRRDPRPDSRLSRISSGSWNVALALAAPEGLYDVERAEPRWGEPTPASLARLVVIQGDDELLRHYPRRWPARVQIETGDGIAEEVVVDAPGDPASAEPAEQIIEHKWRRLGTGSALEALKGAAARATTTPGWLRRLGEGMRSLTAEPRTAARTAKGGLS